MMCSEATSPRVSFSRDIGQADAVPRRDTTLLDMNSDFEFDIASSSSEHESCSADELFANGVILPVQFQETSRQVQKKCAAPPTVSALPPLPRPSNENSKKYFQILEVNKDSDQKPQQSKSFWGFKRSNSLNCDAKKSLICSLSLLSRSNSTGSVTNNKKSSTKDLQNKPGSQKFQVSSSSNPSSASHQYKLQQKKKNYGNGVKISPVLNVPAPYISKGTANLFGLGSFLRGSGSKDKKNKK